MAKVEIIDTTVKEAPAPKDGVVKKLYVKENDTVNTGDPLVELE